MPRNESARYYTIGEVARLLDLEPHVIRYWEKEFPQLRPRRLAGRRLYGPREIEILRRIKQLLYEEGYTIAGARKALSERETSPHRLLVDLRRELEALYRILNS